MATMTQYPSFRSLRIAVPITTALFGILGMSTGLQASLKPSAEAARMFGISPPTNIDTSSEADNRQRAYIQIHGVRNVANSVGMLGLLTFWRFSSTCQSSSAAANAVQKALAILMAAGVLVGVGDGLILKRYSWCADLSTEAKTLAQEKSPGHIAIMLPVFGLALGWWYL